MVVIKIHVSICESTNKCMFLFKCFKHFAILFQCMEDMVDTEVTVIQDTVDMEVIYLNSIVDPSILQAKFQQNIVKV